MVRSDIEFIANTCYFDLIVLDEAVELKNPDTRLYESFKTLMQRVNPKCRFVLTATPLEKKLEDLYSVVDLVVPNLLGDRETFMAAHCIERSFKNRRRFSFKKVVRYINVEQVHETLLPYYIRRKSDEVDESLDRLEIVRKVELSTKERATYSRISSMDGSSMQAALRKFQLKEKCVDTLSYFDPNDSTSTKADEVVNLLLTELLEEKVLIFSKHHLPLDILRQRFDQVGITHTSFTGKMDAEEREKNRLSFQNNKNPRVCLITKAAHKGLNFHSARYVIFFNRYYNPAVEEQIIGRIDRPMAQLSKWVAVIHILAKDTHEEQLKQRMEKEKGLFVSIFGKMSNSLEIPDEVLGKFLNEGGELDIDKVRNWQSSHVTAG